MKEKIELTKQEENAIYMKVGFLKLPITINY